MSADSARSGSTRPAPHRRRSRRGAVAIATMTAVRDGPCASPRLPAAMTAVRDGPCASPTVPAKDAPSACGRAPPRRSGGRAVGAVHECDGGPLHVVTRAARRGGCAHRCRHGCDARFSSCEVRTPRAWPRSAWIAMRAVIESMVDASIEADAGDSPRSSRCCGRTRACCFCDARHERLECGMRGSEIAPRRRGQTSEEMERFRNMKRNSAQYVPGAVAARGVCRS